MCVVSYDTNEEMVSQSIVVYQILQRMSAIHNHKPNLDEYELYEKNQWSVHVGYIKHHVTIFVALIFWMLCFGPALYCEDV